MSTFEQVVYKARRKKSIDYFAIKSVEKSQRERALQEIEALSSLSHPGIVQFVSFYETSRHVWLILEYCVGGNLQELLQQVGYFNSISAHPIFNVKSRAFKITYVFSISE